MDDLSLVTGHFVAVLLLWLALLIFALGNWFAFVKQRPLYLSVAIMVVMAFHFLNQFTSWYIQAVSLGEFAVVPVFVTILDFAFAFCSQTALFVSVLLIVKGWCIMRPKIHIIEHRVLYGIAIGFLVVTFFTTLYRSIPAVPLLADIVLDGTMLRIVYATSQRCMLIISQSMLSVQTDVAPLARAALRAKFWLISTTWKSFVFYIVADLTLFAASLFVTHDSIYIIRLLRDFVQVAYIALLAYMFRRRDFGSYDRLPPFLFAPRLQVMLPDDTPPTEVAPSDRTQLLFKPGVRILAIQLPNQRALVRGVTSLSHVRLAVADDS